MKTIFKILKTAGRYKLQLFIATITLLAFTGINLAAPAFIRRMYAVLENPNAYDATEEIIIIALILLGLYLARVLLQFINNYFAHIAAWNSVASLRERIYTHIQALSLRYHNDKQTGQLMSRVVEDTANFEVLIAHALPDFVSGALVFIGVAVIMFFINPFLAALVCVPLPLIFLCSLFLKRIRRHFTARQEASAQLNSALHDNFSGMKEIQIFNRQEFESEKVSGIAQKHASLTMKAIFWVSLLHPSMNFLSGLGTIAVVAIGGIAALNGNMTVADITIFFLYLGLFYAPVATLSRVLEDIQTAVVSGKRVFEVLDAKSDVTERPDARDAGRLNGDIAFKNVSFGYDTDIAVLKNVSFTAPRGKMVALVGPTGAGKSTITSLLARFYDADSGEITIDGLDIKDITLKSLRDQIGIVPQDVFLFNGTIAENIAYGRRDGATAAEIEEAARAACVHEYIESLPDKYDTVIGERGVRLSGGQKQRLAIARAVLRNAPVLILDEATSAVDNETEAGIQTAIERITGKSTIIVIAHRLSTVKRADKILVLKDGKIVESGTHAALLKRGGEYAKLQKR